MIFSAKKKIQIRMTLKGITPVAKKDIKDKMSPLKKDVSVSTEEKHFER